jgi:predicted permease
MHDVRYAVRVLRRSPGFAAVAILSLALGIGANTAIFSASWVLFAQPLAVQDPGSLLAVTNQMTIPRGVRGIYQINGSGYRDAESGRTYRSNLSFPAYLALREAAGDAADVFAYTFVGEANVALEGWATTAGAGLVSGNYFRGTGVSIAMGRALTDEDDHPGASAAVISHRFWVTAFGGGAVLGKSVRVNGVPFTIVGVSGPGFVGMSRGGFFPPMDVTIPLQAQPAVRPAWGPPGESLFTSDQVFWIHSMARVREKTSIPALQTRLATTFAQWLKASSVPGYQQATDVEVRLLPGGGGVDTVSRRAGQPARILMGVVAVVLLLACVNLANLMLARGVARTKETSIRLALGSGRWRLVRQALVESLIVAAAGAAIGMWIGVSGGRAVMRMLTVGVGPIAMTVDPDWRLLALTVAIACIATVLFGVFPALRLVRRDIVPLMKPASAGGGPRLRASAVLMAAQIAVSVPLVAGAVIFLQTVHNLGRVDLGFNPDRLVSFRIDPSLSGYDRARVEQIYERVLERVRAIPGISSATLMSEPLLAGTTSNTSVTLDDGSNRALYFNRVGPDYFTTMGIPVMAGRSIETRDRTESPRVMVINQAAVAALFGNQSPLGRRVKLFDVDTEIVGVVGDTKYDNVRNEKAPTMFLPYTQTSAPLTLGGMYVVTRASVAPAVVTGALRSVVSDVDRDVPVSRMKTQTQQVQDSLATEIAFTRLLLAFAVFALFLACIGLHGITAYTVARRTNEIGLRIALGAPRRTVLWLIVRQVAVVTAIGLALGVPLAIAAARAAASLLYGVKPIDPVSLAVATVLMAIVAGLAAYLPARRAARLEPLAALRVE